MIVVVSAVGLALKDHGRDRTLKGLYVGAPLALPHVRAELARPFRVRGLPWSFRAKLRLTIVTRTHMRWARPEIVMVSAVGLRLPPRGAPDGSGRRLRSGRERAWRARFRRRSARTLPCDRSRRPYLTIVTRTHGLRIA